MFERPNTMKFKIGDRVKGDCDYSFDPLIKGIIVGGFYNVYEVKVLKSTTKNTYAKKRTWHYGENNLKQISCSLKDLIGD